MVWGVLKVGRRKGTGGFVAANTIIGRVFHRGLHEYCDLLASDGPNYLIRRWSALAGAWRNVWVRRADWERVS